MSWTCTGSRVNTLAAARTVECPGIIRCSNGLSRRGKRATTTAAVAAAASSSSFRTQMLLLRLHGLGQPYSSSSSLFLINNASSLFDRWNLSRRNSFMIQSFILSKSQYNYHRPNHRHRYFSQKTSTSPSGLDNNSISSSNSINDNRQDEKKTVNFNNSDGGNCNASPMEPSRAQSRDKNNAQQSIASDSNMQQTYHQPFSEPINNNHSNICISSTDNDKSSFVYSVLPISLHPYARLSRIDKPIGTFLLLHPCLWSVALASSSSSTTIIPSTTSTSFIPLLADDTASNITTSTFTSATNLLHTLIENTNIQQNIVLFLSLCTTFALGSFIMRSAGCTINDMWDASYDRSVARTKSRPLASGELTHAQAAKFLALQLGCGLGALVSLPHVEECVLWGMASMPLVVAYPLMKRYTNFPQVVLGMTFNWGAILGWVAVRGGGEHIDWTVVGPLYVAGIAWTVVYDTLYAHQDKKDDEKLGLKSTALTFGDSWTKPILTACTAITWGGWMMAGYNCGFGTEDMVALSALFDQDSVFNATTTAAVAAQNAYYVGVSAAATHMLWQIYTANLNDANNLAHRFKSNNLVGWIVFGSCCVAAGGSNVILAAC